MKQPQLTQEEFEKVIDEIAKKSNCTLPEYVGSGLVKITTDGITCIMRADTFHEAMKKEAENQFTLPKFRKTNMVKIIKSKQQGKVTRVHSEKLGWMYEIEGIRGVFAEVELTLV